MIRTRSTGHFVERFNYLPLDRLLFGRIAATDTAIVLGFIHDAVCHEVLSRTSQTEIAIRSTSNVIGVVVILPIVFPPAEVADLILSSATKSRIATARTREAHAVSTKGGRQ